MAIEEYPYVVKVQFTDHAVYYNSGNYCLYLNPYNANRYKTEEAAQKDVDYASCQGGVGSVALFKEEYEKFRENI